MPTIEIIRRKRSANQQLRARIDALVRERVDEILSRRDGEMLDGEFAPKSVDTEIFRRTTVFHRRKWALYFAHWGCRQCKKKRLMHAGLGYCPNCYHLVQSRLAQLKQNWDAEHPQHPPEIDAIDEKIRTAKAVFAAADPVD